MFSIKKKPAIRYKRLIFIWEKGFVCTTFHGRGQNMDGTKKATIFFGPETSVFARKSVFCITTPVFVNSPIVARREMVHFAPSERFFDFLFPSWVVFAKSPADAPKSLPPPHSGAPSARNSPSALSARAG